MTPSQKIYKDGIRPLYEIAQDIKDHWPKMSEYAKPYWSAMKTLTTLKDKYYEDDAESIILYFLSNATGWRGEDAKRIKAELKAMIGLKK